MMKPRFVLLLLPLLVACGDPVSDTGGVNTDESAALQDRAMTPALDAGTDVVTEEDESAALTAWLDEQFAEQLDFSPQWKTRLGDKSDYGQLDDPAEAADEQALEWRRNSVAEMQSTFSYDLLGEDAKTSWDTWVYSLERAEMAAPYRRHGYIFGRGGPHASLPSFMINFHRVDEAGDMTAYISRLSQIDDVLGQYQQRAVRAIEDGIRQPRFNYDYAIAEIDRVTSGEPFTDEGISPLWNDVENKITVLFENNEIDQATARQMMDEARAVLVDELQPAYAELLTWLQQDRANASEQAMGVWALPNGEDYYNMRLSLMTTLDMTADEIHNIGLAEVDRLRTEMEAIKDTVEFDGTLAEFFVFIREDDQFYFPNTDEGREAYLQLARDYLEGMDEVLPQYFGILPQAGLEVRRVESFREQDGAAQHYMSGTPDGSRPGVFYAHLSDMRAMPRYQLENISYHEGSPGHHMQISIQQELTDIPRFRTQYGYTAFSEGWGLYSEALGKDMGFYEDPYSDFGRLAGEIWRAIRLVVDTGMHAKQWTEEQAVQYFLANSPQPESAVRSEIQRYLHNPGQATAYKIGMLKIQELRATAMQELSDDFDYRGFHDTVLGGGAVPLPILEARVMRWVDSVRQGE